MIRSIPVAEVGANRGDSKRPRVRAPAGWGSNLVRLSDGQIAAIGAGYGPFNQEHVVRRIDAHHFEVAHRDLVVSEMPRLADSLLGPRRVGAGSRGTGVAMHPLDAVR